MFLKHIDLTTALRPSYLPDEVLLFVQDNVGLYEGLGNELENIDAHESKLADLVYAGSSSSQINRMARFT